MDEEETPVEFEYIQLKVMSEDNSKVLFKTKTHIPLRKLMNAYCDRKGLAMSAVRFKFDGQRIDETETPISLALEEGDTIEVYQLKAGEI